MLMEPCLPHGCAGRAWRAPHRATAGHQRRSGQRRAIRRRRPSLSRFSSEKKSEELIPGDGHAERSVLGPGKRYLNDHQPDQDERDAHHELAQRRQQGVASDVVVADLPIGNAFCSCGEDEVFMGGFRRGRLGDEHHLAGGENGDGGDRQRQIDENGRGLIPVPRRQTTPRPVPGSSPAPRRHAGSFCPSAPAPGHVTLTEKGEPGQRPHHEPGGVLGQARHR